MDNGMAGFIGIDTSCYTTSGAILDKQGNLLADVRIPLQVKPGGRGLAQSEMVFQHVRNLPQVFSRLKESLPILVRPAAIGVTACPRPAEDSYMPAFLAGESCAMTLAALYETPVYRFSHQENHILAGMWSAQGPDSPRFLAMHVSGGTTEAVLASAAGLGFQIEPLGESLDLHAGQFIDRIGVALGLPFPAGPYLEKLAAACESPAPVPIAVIQNNISFSGPESHALRLIQKGCRPEAIARGVEHCIAESLSLAARRAAETAGLSEVLWVGGVTANRYIRLHVAAQLSQAGIKAYFPAKEYSPDNAVGAAFFALRH